MTLFASFAAVHRRASTRDDDEGFALIYAVLIILVFTLLSTVALALFVNQVRPTQFERKRAQTLDNAQAGIDAGLALLRNAKLTGTTTGVPGLIPCNSVDHEHLTGAVDGSGSGTNTYTVDVYYYGADTFNNPYNPSGLTVAQAKSSSYRMSCNASTGGLAATPTYAYLISVGAAPALAGSSTSASTGNRQLHASYQFTSTNDHPVGGQISFVTAAGHNDCWDAGNPPAGGGTTVTYQTCGPAGTPSQTWLYRNDLSVQWQGNTALNLCLDYTGLTRSSSSKQQMTLKPCLGDGTYASAFNVTNDNYDNAGLPYQEFGEIGGFIGVAPQGVLSNDGYKYQDYGDRDPSACLESNNATTTSQGEPNDALAMWYSCPGNGDNGTTFSAGTGAGAAAGNTTGLPSSTTGQIVPYAIANGNVVTPTVPSGNRCIDVKDSTPSRGLITFPCHEAPNVRNLEQNERFTGPAAGVAGQVTVYRDQFPTGSSPNFASQAAPFCLGSSHTAASFGGLGFYVSVTACTGAPTQQWVFAGSAAATLADQYTIKDSSGYCLVAGGGPPDPPEGFAGWYQEKEVYAGVCNGQDNQKWNAPPGVTHSPLLGFGEDVRP